MLSFSFLCLPNSLSFRSPSHWGRSSERATSSCSCSMQRWADPTDHLHPHLLCQNGLCWPMARPAATIPSLHSLFRSPIYPLSGTQTDGSLECPGMLCRSVFCCCCCCYACPVRCKLKGREKRNNSHHHDADITPITVILTSMSDSFNIWIPRGIFLLSWPCLLEC